MKSKMWLIIIIIIVGLISVGIGGFFAFKEHKEEDTFDISAYIVPNDCYKTNDQEYQFFFISRENEELFNLIDSRLSKELPKDYEINHDDIKEFVYINEELLIITYKEDIGNYSRYVGFFAKSPRSMNNEVFLINNQDKTIIEKEEKIASTQDEFDEFKKMLNRFSSEENDIFPYKSESGYFFFEKKSYGPNYYVVYTEELKKIGYIDKDLTKLEEDDGGIFIYDNSKLEGESKRYNALGNVVEEYIENSTVTIDIRGEDYTINYASLEEEILDKINKNNYKIYLKTCDCSKVRDEGYLDRAKCEEKELSVDSVKKVIKKLQRADKVEYKLTNKVCAKYSFYVNSKDTILNLREADDISTMLVGFDNKAFSYHYTKENVELFLKSLGE